MTDMEYTDAALTLEERATLKLRGLYEQYGYRKFKMSKFEEYALYAGNEDFLTGDKVIAFTDLDGRLMALKPDVTLSVIKNSRADRSNSEKLYYIENVYREDKSANNFVELSQMGLEFIGNVDDFGITEVLSLASRSLAEIKSEYILEISHMEFVTELLGSMNLAYEDYIHLLKLIRRKNADGIAKIGAKAGLGEGDISALKELTTLYGGVEETIERARRLVVNTPMADALDQLRDVCAGLSAFEDTDKIAIDLSIVNDIDYYNGIIFRGYFDGIAGTVLSGGQYDRAMRKFNRNVGAIGFAIYLNELDRLEAEKTDADVDVLLVYEEGMKPKLIAPAVKKLRESGKSVRACSAIPEGLKYKKAVKLAGEGKLSEFAPAAETCASSETFNCSAGESAHSASIAEKDQAGKAGAKC